MHLIFQISRVFNYFLLQKIYMRVFVST